MHIRDRLEQVFRQAVINGRKPVGLRQRLTLVVGDRHDRRFVERAEDWLQFWQIETAVHGRQERHRLAREQRERVIVDVKMQHIEFVSAAADFFQQQHVGRHRVADGRVEAQRLRPEGFELRRRLRITAREQRDVVTGLNQRLGQIGHHALRTAVELRGTAS